MSSAFVEGKTERKAEGIAKGEVTAGTDINSGFVVKRKMISCFRRLSASAYKVGAPLGFNNEEYYVQNITALNEGTTSGGLATRSYFSMSTFGPI